MTESEREWTQQVHRQAMEIVGICGLLSLRAPTDSIEAERGNRAALKALALAQDAMNRLNADGVAVEAQEVADADYNLAALACAAPSAIED